MANRPGFIIPNAGDVSLGLNRQAEPDAGDFSILGSENYGVLTGFDFTVSASLFQINTSSAINVAVIDGVIYRTGNLSVGLTAGGVSDRFDLVVYTPLSVNDNKLSLITGPVSDHPTFPDIPAGALVIAAITVPAGIATSLILPTHVVDKRRWMLNGARGAVPLDGTFLENRYEPLDGNPESTTYKVLGDGTTNIGHFSIAPVFADGGVELQISGGIVRFMYDKVAINGDLDVGGHVTAGGVVNGSNLITAAIAGTPPSDAGSTGSLFQDTVHGRVYVKRPNGQYAEIYADEYPPGTLIASLLSGQAAVDYLSGSWLECNGASWPAADYPRLAAAFPNWVFGDKIATPNLKGKFLGSEDGGVVGNMYGANNQFLTLGNLPSHSHLTGGSTTGAGGHNHGSNVSGGGGGHTHAMGVGGQHQHHITDPGHVHNGAEHGINVPSPFVHMTWGGAYTIDVWPAGAGHGPVVDFSWYTVYAYTNITQTDNDGMHSHQLDTKPDHTHSINLNPVLDHTHALPTENAVGQNQSFDNRPAFISVAWYVKA